MAVSEKNLAQRDFFDSIKIILVEDLLELNGQLNLLHRRGAQNLTIGYIPRTKSRDDYFSFIAKYSFSRDSFAGQISVDKKTTEQYLLGRSDLEGRREELQEFLQIQRQNYIMDLPL